MYWVTCHLRAPSKATRCDVSGTGLVDLLDAASLGRHDQSEQDREVYDTVTLAVLGQSGGLGLWPVSLTHAFTPSHLCAGSPLSFSITPQEASCPCQP